ncbi:MAG: DNA replication/repair protein RecF [Anaerolineales bacterium]
MQIHRLSLTNFRNFARLETDLPAGPTLLIGDNAQGKTSLLESIYYLTGATSPHTSSDREIINFLALVEPNPFARLVAEVERNERVHRIEIRLQLDTNSDRLKKEVLVNGVNRRIGELAQTLNAVMFLPQDLDIIEGSPGGRRRFMDALIRQADPLYDQALTEYAKALSQRNALLKQLHERSSWKGQVDIWDEQLAEHGAVILRGRTLALQELQAIAQPIHDQLSRGREVLRISYDPAYDPLAPTMGQIGLDLEIPVDRSGFSRHQIQEGLLAALHDARAEEIRRGVTRIGPHRDDVRFIASGLDLHSYGSRGQNRTAVLSVKLAEVKWLHGRTGEWPVLLLDEVLAELDASRREDLLGYVSQVNQAVLTAADIDMFTERFCQSATLWRVRAGAIEAYST